MKKAKFEWDAKKNKENKDKHGISFELAQYAFTDPDRIIAEDLNHSQNEKRFYSFGKVGDVIITVCFTYRGSVILYALLVRGIGEKEGEYMKAELKLYAIGFKTLCNDSNYIRVRSD